MTKNTDPGKVLTLPAHTATRLLGWYDSHARDLPWRVPPEMSRKGVKADPYRVWLSEVMLQQTTIAHGTRYFLEFTRRWPTVEALADAETDALMAAWAGLGYYARARNLYACAKAVVELGGFPQTVEGLRKLPGIGPYTAGAIAAIAFGEPVCAIDGNVERVISRLLALDLEKKAAHPVIAAALQPVIPQQRPGDFAQALMDLGATVCTPRTPDCASCPLSGECAAFRTGTQARFPVKAARTTKPERRGRVLVIIDDGRVMAKTRPETGLLGGMPGLPTSDWSTSGASSLEETDVSKDAVPAGQIVHVFTHFRLTLDVFIRDATEAERQDPQAIWVDPSDGRQGGLPSVFLKAARLALATRQLR